MGMQFGTESRRRRILIALGLLLAVIAAVGAFTLVNRPPPTVPVIPTIPVLVAASAIDARTAIEPGQVILRDVPESAVLEEALRDPSQAVGRLTLVAIYPGQQITPNLFGDVGDVDFSILDPEETIEPNSPFWRAVAVTMPAEKAVGGNLHAGQTIDIIATVPVEFAGGDCVPEPAPVPVPGESPAPLPTPTPTAGDYCNDISTKITFENMRILFTIPETNIYILRADLHQAEELTFVAKNIENDSVNWSFSAVLRPDRDTRVIDRLGYGESYDRLLRQYRYVIPELLDLLEFTPNPPPGDLPPSPAP
jgi:Flp pilus assembly protein CpaB